LIVPKALPFQVLVFLPLHHITAIIIIKMAAPPSKTQRYVADILSNWSLTDPTTILPVEWAPRDPNGSDLLTWRDVQALAGSAATTHPTAWPKHFAEELRKLSGIARGQHAQAVQLLVEAAQYRANTQGEYAVAQIIQADVKNVLERWKVGEGAVKEVRREEQDNATFVGGLKEGLPEEEKDDGGVAVPSGGGWTMALPILDSARQQSGGFGAEDVRYHEREL
jgi:hypothetical protein